MSDVTNIVVLCDISTEMDGIFLRRVDRWLRIRTAASLRGVSPRAGGNKNMEIHVAAGAFNHFPWEEFRAALPMFVDEKRMKEEGGFIIVNIITQDESVHTWRLICE